ncbi:unnamed protein product [Polarella glacialis]|uniref:Uncharacterized protein n=1 Tax=Polarella glacialis TaxID=89957 RepID=A0A813KYC4_POLGL|nr:unnamed protein product [Polarella glacialis]
MSHSALLLTLLAFLPAPGQCHAHSAWSEIPAGTTFSWQELARVPAPRASDPQHQFSTFRSAPLRLDVGRVVLTPPKQTSLLMPPGPFVLTSLRLEVVRAADGQPVPLTEVYNHHIAFYAAGGKVGADVCGGAHLDNFDALWATGAEARGTTTEFPEGLGLPGKGPWFANIHLIRSEGVPHVKRCIECACDLYGGSEDCCRHMSICPGFPEGMDKRNSSDVKEYAVQYTVGWSPDTTRYQLLKYMTLDATGCQLEFQVPAQCPWMWRHDTLRGPVSGSVGLRGSGRDLPSDFEVAVRPPPAGCVTGVSWEYTLPPGAAGRLVFSKGHVHVGGLSVSATVLRRQRLRRGGGNVSAGSFEEAELLCKCEAKYGHTEAGQPGFVGDELGYVVGVSTCHFDAAAARPVLREGDRIRVETSYRTDLWFNGVMGLIDLAILPDVPDADDMLI